MNQPEITPESCAAIYGGSALSSDDKLTSDKPAAQALTTDEPQPEAKPVDKLVEEAEQRGYLRGRNEALAGIYASPAVWEEPDSNISEPMLRPSPADSFLTGRRKGVWD